MSHESVVEMGYGKVIDKRSGLHAPQQQTRVKNKRRVGFELEQNVARGETRKLKLRNVKRSLNICVSILENFELFFSNIA